MNMQISNQQVNVGHEFERRREREIVAVRETGVQTNNLLPDIETPKQQTANEDAYDVSLSPELLLKKKLIESVSGKSIETYADIQNNKEYLAIATQSYTLYAAQIDNTFVLDGNRVSENARLSVKETVFEYEQLDYQTSVLITDENGKQRELGFSLSLSRELNISRELSMSVTEFKDPLILNLDNNPELFQNTTQQFDLDADGQAETIPELNSGVWYLAYDRNQNGQIDNGFELFGAQTGRGFEELKQFDSDNNGIIDKQDARFHDLQLWNGSATQQSLQGGGVKAISLNAVDTPFTFTDNQGRARAQLRQTSVYLTQQNKLGAIHQVDFAV